MVWLEGMLDNTAIIPKNVVNDISNEYNLNYNSIIITDTNVKACRYSHVLDWQFGYLCRDYSECTNTFANELYSLKRNILSYYTKHTIGSSLLTLRCVRVTPKTVTAAVTIKQTKASSQLSSAEFN